MRFFVETVFGKNNEQILYSFGSEAETLRLFENVLFFCFILFSVFGSCKNNHQTNEKRN